MSMDNLVIGIWAILLYEYGQSCKMSMGNLVHMYIYVCRCMYICVDMYMCMNMIVSCMFIRAYIACVCTL